jgi:hypothetical protein
MHAARNMFGRIPRFAEEISNLRFDISDFTRCAPTAAARSALAQIHIRQLGGTGGLRQCRGDESRRWSARELGWDDHDARSSCT